MAGVLYVVATPIGNLEDITLRALRVLREASLIAAEDTRRTARLLQHYSISTPTTSLHEHNERTRSAALLARLAAGDSIALVSDAGTPLVSDPGAYLVRTAHKAGIRVEPIPGPSAAIAAISASGLSAGEFLFAGFPPARAAARRAWLSRMSTEPRAVVIYEAPHRIRETLQEILAVCGNRIVALGRELTKAHEEIVITSVAEQLTALENPRGEYTLVLAPGDQSVESEVRPLPEPSSLFREFGELTDIEGAGRRAALRTLSTKYGMSAKALYSLIEQAKKSVE